MIAIQVMNFLDRPICAHISEDETNLGQYPHLYATGKLPPNYPVPAIPYRAVIGKDYMWGTVYIERLTDTVPVMVSIYDENFDRCLDFGSPWGEFYFT